MHAAELHLPAQIHIAGGCSGELEAVAARLGMRRPLIVTDPYMAEHGRAGRFAEALGAPLFSGVEADPTWGHVRTESGHVPIAHALLVDAGDLRKPRRSPI